VSSVGARLRGAVMEGVEDSDGVRLVHQAGTSVSVAQRKSAASSLVASAPPVILQRKTGAMMARVVFL